MLHLYQSNRLEHLAELMAALYTAQPLNNILAAEEIVVQSQGMRRYISRFLAQRHGIAANLRFSLPAGFNWRLIREHIGGLPETDPFDTEVMRWRLAGLFASDDFRHDAQYADIREALSAYLNQSPAAAYQLSGQIADVFDQYLVYRPDWIEQWQQGKPVAGLGSEQNWQLPLWQYLDHRRHGSQDRIGLQKQLYRFLERPDAALPQRFTVFGIAAMAPVYLQLFIRLAKHSDVHIFALNPSAEYWGQLMSAEALLVQGGGETHGHPLLASLGKQGRDFFDTLSDTETATDLPVFDLQAVSGSLLHSLQHQIQTLTPPESAQNDWLQSHGLNTDTALHHLQRHDRSIQIHSAHSPLRELHILKDHILKWLDEHPDWQPHDIAVLTPHIEPYAPFIEAVFAQGSRPLPYSLSDVRLARGQPLLQALEQVLELLTGRFETDRLLPLLDSPPLLRRFGLNREDLPLLYDTVARLNIRWGADAEQRREHGGRANLFTWQQGLERMILGWLLPEHSPVWQNISAWHTGPAHLDTLNRFAALVRTLTDTRRLWQTPADTAGWTERLHRLCADLFDPDTDDLPALQQFEQSLAQWRQQADLAEFTLPLDVHTAAVHIRRFLGSRNDAGFLRGGITFCGMVPMRSLPFKALCLLGLNDGAFPRNTKAAPFDLIARHPRQGDRARRDDDRYLFLEALLSAREILYLSYVGRHIRTDDELAPSVLLNELTDTVSALTGIASDTLAEQWIVRHPLQPFSPRYFQADPQLFSSRSDYAEALNHPLPAPAPFYTAHAPTPEAAGDSEQPAFIRFWRNPLRSYLKHSLHWRPPYPDPSWNTAEPFAAEHAPALERAYLDARRRNRDFEQVAAELQAQSLLPAGELGNWLARDYAARAAALDGTLLHSPRLPEMSGRIRTASGSLNYRLNRLHRHGLILSPDNLGSGGLSAADTVEMLLLHLIYCAAETAAAPRESHYLSLQQSFSLPPLTQADAADALSRWLSAYREGRHSPLPFFPRVSLRTALTLYGKDGASWEDAQKTALSVYLGGYQGFAEADYPEVALIYGRLDGHPLDGRFRELTENLFAPLQDCLKALSFQAA